MVYKYLIKEAKVGDIKTDKGVKSTVTSIDPITKSISWDIDYVPAFDSTFKEFTELRRFITKLSRDTKDETIDKIADEVTNSFNKYRTHIRKNYPEQYKKAKINELDLSHHMELGNDWGEVIFYLEKYGTDEEIDAYITAFKEQAGPYFDDSNFDHVKEFQKWVKTAMRTDEISTSGGAGAYNTPYAFKLVKKQKKIVPEGIGTTLGPGPKAGPEGVKDNAYVKQFKYKLVPKTKDDTYVQKGSGMVVKNLF
tara:strand:- start:85 stop:840 length:756 start_codon:yes stop_codon:yes gene_type:complete